jgi:biotin operon repressor
MAPLTVSLPSTTQYFTQPRAVSFVPLQASGVSPLKLQDDGFSIADLKQSGFLPGQLRREVGASLGELRGAGFTVAELRADGFGPADLRDAGFELAEVKRAGYTAPQLYTKAGYTLKQLREAGYSVKEVKAIDGLTQQMVLEAGFPLKAVFKAGFTREYSDGTTPPPKSVADAAILALKAARAASTSFALPERRLPGLEALDPHPPELPAKSVMGPSGRVYTSAVTRDRSDDCALSVSRWPVLGRRWPAHTHALLSHILSFRSSVGDRHELLLHACLPRAAQARDSHHRVAAL